MAKTQYVHIENVCKEIFAGGDVPKNALSYVKTEEYCVPIFSNGEKDNGLYGYTNHARVNEPSITVSARGTIGYTSKRCEPFFPVVRLITLTPKDDVIDLDYLFYATQNYKFEGSGTSIPQLTVPMLKKYAFPLPELEEQKAIAKLFQKLDCLISLRKQQLVKLDELVKARFLELFGDPLNNAKGWPKSTITEVCTAIFGGGTPSKSHPEYFTGSIPWVSPKDMKMPVISDSIDHITEEAIAHSTTNPVPANSVLMVIRSGILKHTLPVAINSVPVTINQDMKAFVPNDIVTTAFLVNYFRAIENDVLSDVRGVTADNIDFKTFLKRKIIVPPLSLQNEFAAFVERVDQQKQTVQQSLEKLELMKTALMQEYFG